MEETSIVSEMVVTSGPKKLTRLTDEAWISGVCSGLAKHLEVDVLLIRILTIGLTLFAGVIPLIYVIMAFLVPAATLPAGKISTERRWILWLMVFFLVFPILILIALVVLAIANAVIYGIMG
jgi:phage shock protein PspC (stress-responsive transcriptional regulator)